MTVIPLAFAHGSIDLTLDDDRYAVTVLTPHDAPALPDSHAAFLSAVRAPLGCVPLNELARGERTRRVCIVISDHTRSVPDDRLVPWLVAELGVDDAAVTILIGTGTHRGSTRQELEAKLGVEVCKRFRIINHDCQHEQDLVRVGTSPCGGVCWLNRHYVEADVRLATGFIEPHFYAGFSGGSKAIVPGIAGLDTIRHFHRASLIAHPGTTWGDLRANPLQALTRQMTALLPPHCIVNVTLNLRKEITGIYVGEVGAAHDAGSVRATVEAMCLVSRRFPVVVTSNSGHPLDQNFYQTVKGISAAARIIEPGGTIVVASACTSGLPREGEFSRILAEPVTNSELLARICEQAVTRHDQWQVQTLLQCLQQARVILFSTLSADDRRLTRTGHSDNIAQTLNELRMAWTSNQPLPIAVLPMGPLTIPTFNDGALTALKPA